jgi:DNA topoisomerase VI subunit B
MAQISSDKQTRVPTAIELASRQREISVSEFFLKNRHLLGFDTPAKALVTAVKEAVDNALDACEEAGVLPEIVVHVRDRLGKARVVVEDNGPGIVESQIARIFRQTALWIEIPQTEPVARSTGNGNLGRGNVRSTYRG